MFRLVHALRTSMWLVPAAIVAAGAGLAAAEIAIDRTHPGLVPVAVTGDSADLSTILSAFATSVATLTGLVVTMTLVVVQLAMGQFTPRIVRSLLEGHPSHVVIGIFGATFVVSVLALRELHQHEAVPGVTVLLAYGLMALSIAALLLYVHKIGKALRVSTLIEVAGEDARKLVDRLYPHDGTRESQASAVVASPASGHVFKVDRRGLVAAAADAGCVLELVPAVGDFVPEGGPLFRVRGGDRSALGDVARCVAIASERTTNEDLAYALRLLVDIGERSLAQPFDDPTTTVQAIHRLHEILRRLAPRPFPSGNHYDDAGELRLVERTLDWDGYVRLAFDEIRLAGASSPQVPRRLRDALEDLKTVAPPDRQAPLDRQLALLDAAVERELEDPRDVDAVRVADRQGIGSGDDLVGGRAAV
jgi:uncharacterized membrane protein